MKDQLRERMELIFDYLGDAAIELEGLEEYGLDEKRQKAMDKFAKRIGVVFSALADYTEKHPDLKTSMSLTGAELKAEREGRGQLYRLPRRKREDGEEKD
jgi:hypothetical protein